MDENEWEMKTSLWFCLSVCIKLRHDASLVLYSLGDGCGTDIMSCDGGGIHIGDETQTMKVVD